MATRKGLSSKGKEDATQPLRSSSTTLSGLADNSILADQIVCVAKKYLERNCDPNDPDLLACMEQLKWQVITLYQGQAWRRQDRSLKTQGDNIWNYYPNNDFAKNPNWCAIFVWEVWWEATYCLGGVDGIEDDYLFKSARVYDTDLSMRLGTIKGGRTLVNTTPSKGSAFTRRRDTLQGGVGHAGMVIDVTTTGFTTIEANGDAGIPIEQRNYVFADIARYTMSFLHIENTPVLNASYPREDGNCCIPTAPPEISPCDGSPKPSGDNWEKTPSEIYLSIVSKQDAQRDFVVNSYKQQGLEFSEEFCWTRTKGKIVVDDCTTYKCPDGYKKKVKIEGQTQLSTVTRSGEVYDQELKAYRKATQTDYCCEKIPTFEVLKGCPPVVINKESCSSAIRVSSATFDPKSVPHYSVLANNMLMAADITGSKWVFQMFSKTGATEIGSALALPPSAPITSTAPDAIEKAGVQYSGFGTFSDLNGNLIVIVPEYQANRLNSLIGIPGKQETLLGAQGFYQVNVPSYMNIGDNPQKMDAQYISGYDIQNLELLDGRVVTALSENNKFYSSQNGNAQRYVNLSNYPKGTSLPDPLNQMIFSSLVTEKTAGRLGFLNQLESNGKKLDKPILIVLKSAPPPFNFLDFLETVLTIASSFAPFVKIPPQVFTTALGALKTIQAIADPSQSTANVLLNIAKLGGMVAALLPEDLRGNINDLLEGVPEALLGKEGVAFVESQTKIVGKYLSDGTKFLQDVEKNAAGALVSLGFKQANASSLVNKYFGMASNAAIDAFKPSWFDFASDYANNLGGNFDSSFQSGVKLLHSIENIKSVQSFGRSLQSGSFATNVIDKGSALQNTDFQNLMLSGLAASVMSSMPNASGAVALIMNQTQDILPSGIYDKADIAEIGAMLKVGNGFLGNPNDFSRLALESLLKKSNNLAVAGATKFVLPPSLTDAQQECWGKELSTCIGIVIVTKNGTYGAERTKVPVTDVPTTLPPCIRQVNGAYKYCPPPGCKVSSLNDEYNPSANYELRCNELALQNNSGIGIILRDGKKTVDKNGETIYNYNGVLYKLVKASIGTAAFEQGLDYTLCEMVEVPVVTTSTKVPVKNTTAPTTTTSTPIAKQEDCTVLYDAKLSNGKWYALLAGQWVEIIDCCPPKQVSEGCCDETQTKLNQMKLDLAKVIELVGRNQAGEKCPECDLTEIKQRLSQLEIPQTTYDDASLRKEMREGFAEMRAMIGQIKQYDNSKDLEEIKQLIKAIKTADLTAVEKEISELKKFIIQQQTIPTVRTGTDTDTNARYEELKNLILSRSTISQKDYSVELAKVQKDLDFLKTQFPITIQTFEQERDLASDDTTRQRLELLIKEQTDLFTKKISDLEQKLTKPCEECTELAKLQTQINEVKDLIKGIKPSTDTVTNKETVREVSNPNDKAEIDRLTRELNLWSEKYDEMFNAFTDAINRNNSQGLDTSDLSKQLDEQIDRYTILIQNLDKKIIDLSNAPKQPDKQPEITVQQTQKTPTTSIPPVIQKTPQETGCVGCPKVVESHTRTIYEYPPVAPVEPCDDCEE